ncbi:MAG: nucleoside phosphorylase [Spirochaetes bacterium]|nr:nucleoside phosphorylase [Spirochaetota bacterium]
MALHKHAYPILEYDTEQKAILMPDRKKLYNLPEKCVFALLGGYVDDYAREHNGIKIAEFDTVTKLFHIHKIEYKGHEICICHVPLGASAATQLLDFIISYGAKKIISCGSCGALHDFEENCIMVPTAALRGEGTSYHYLPPAREIQLNSTAVNAIRTAIEKNGLPFKTCKTWTTDGFYRETKDLVAYRKEEGCDVVEMECAALAACAEFRGAVFGQILFTADTLAVPEAHDDRDWGGASHAAAFSLALDSVIAIP